MTKNIHSFLLLNKYLQTSLVYILSVILLLVWSTPLAHSETFDVPASQILAEQAALDDSSLEEEVASDAGLVETLSVDDQEIETVYPYTKTFVITGYYSPLPGQNRYATGSYESDIVLNGRGTNGASGTPVNIHMFAAPPTYAFGTKITCPGIGTGTVQDRGGAIKGSRLDKWMGYGDIGLTRALQYGKRTVTCVVHGVDPNLPEVSYIDDFSEAEKYIQSIIMTPRVFAEDLYYGATGEDVTKLQEHLAELGYYQDQVNEKYGELTREAVLAFQRDYNVIADDSELGAGTFGPQTRLKLEAILEKRAKEELPAKKLKKGNTGEDVVKLQEALNKLGYEVEVTGDFDDATEEALFRFQLDHDLIDSEDDLAAGYLGSKTISRLTYSIINQSAIEDELNAEAIPNTVVLLGGELSFGDTGQEVYRLQEQLVALNFLKNEPTGYYGKYTEHAVLKFQQANYLAANSESPGAGVFGPITRQKMNGIVSSHVSSQRLIADANGKQGPTVIAFAADLAPGARSKDVEDLQVALKELGYFDYQFVTDYYGEVTKAALMAFQLDHGVIDSESDQGAGVFGPQTRVRLSEVLNHSA